MTEALETLLRGDGRPALDARLDRLEHNVEAVRERAMRRTLATDFIAGLPEAELVATMAALVERAQQGNGRARAVLVELALEPNVFQQMPYPRVKAAYGIAQGGGLAAIARMFLGAALEQNPTIDEAWTGNEFMDVPLGNRRAAARGRDRNTLDRLLHDRDHRVIALLLDNPRLVERDVVKIAATRPTRPEVLQVIARHGRWSSRYPVKKALVGNPYTPMPIARRLLPTLLAQDLRALVELGALGEELLLVAKALLPRPAAPAPSAAPLFDEAELAELYALVQEESTP
jgi:hypothetical protein